MHCHGPPRSAIDSRVPSLAPILNLILEERELILEDKLAEERKLTPSLPQAYLNDYHLDLAMH